jgi:hypothetical protein
MNAALNRHSVWLNRLVMGFAILVFSLIAVRTILDPVGSAAAHKIVLGSPAAITNTRISGGVFLAMALVLAGSVIARQRHRSALLLLAVFSAVLTAVRLFGLVVDGPAPFTLKVLKPEIAVTVLAAVAYTLERRRATP